MISQSLLKEFQAKVGADNVFADDADRLTYSYDAAVLDPVMPALFTICVMPVGNDGVTFTVKVMVPVAPAGRLPTKYVQTALPQLQPGWLAAGSKPVCAGTVSVMTTPVASCVPRLA